MVCMCVCVCGGGGGCGVQGTCVFSLKTLLQVEHSRLTIVMLNKLRCQIDSQSDYLIQVVDTNSHTE